MIHTIPDSIRRAIRSPLARSFVQTEAPSPKFESFARRSASSSESTTMMGTTGPKISSLMIRMSSSTPARTVGRDELAAEAGDLARSAGDALGAAPEGIVDELGDDAELILRDHRADLGLPLQRVAHGELARPAARRPRRTDRQPP